MATSSVALSDTLKVATLNAPPTYRVRRAITMNGLLRITGAVSQKRVTRMLMSTSLRLTSRQTAGTA